MTEPQAPGQLNPPADVPAFGATPSFAAPGAVPAQPAFGQQPGFGEVQPAFGQPPAGYAQPGTGTIGIIRSPIAQWLMMLIPIYGIVHLCSVSEQLKRYDRRVGGSGVATFFAYIPGVYLFLIPPIVSIVHTAGRIRAAQRAAGLPETCGTGASLGLALLFGFNVYYWQSEMNKVWARYPGAPTGAQVPLYA